MTGCIERGRSSMGGMAIAAGLALVISACAPVTQAALYSDAPAAPNINQNTFTSFDGAQLGLSTWTPDLFSQSDMAAAGLEETSTPLAGPSAGDCAEPCSGPPLVVIGVHGMNDYAAQFEDAASWWSAHGAYVYAYDQRGFGRTPVTGVWTDPDVLREDLRTLTRLVRQRHGEQARIAVIGASMGASVALTAFASGDPPDADVLVLSGPGLRGWGALPWMYSVSLWLSAHVRPGWEVVPPKGVVVTPTDNREKQIAMWKDPYVLKETRIDSVYGVVSIMEEANDRIADLPASVPTLFLYGARDEIIPPGGVRRATKHMPAHVVTAYYANGYHMLLNDLQGEVVWRDILSFLRTPSGPLPSHAPPIPWIDKTADPAADGS
ncbi:MAG: alpha/beta fold hydrolase [Hyphomonadaceae bacterium]